MVSLGVRALVAGVLVSSVLLKLAPPRASSSALATFGLRSPRVRWALWGAIVAAEAGLAGAVLAGVDAAAYAGALLMLLFAGVLALALVRGRAGERCGCFGAGSGVGRGTGARC